MPEWKVTQFIYLDVFSNGTYSFHYPAVVFPNVCAICGRKAENSEPLAVQKSKTLSTTYSIATRRDTFALARMTFRIPICTDHAEEIKTNRIAQDKNAKESMILLAISVLVGILAAFLYFSHSPTIAGRIILSIFLGGLGGVLLLWPIVGILLPTLIRVARHRSYANPYTIKDFGLPNATILDDSNQVSMRLVFTFRNEQFYQEFKRLSNVEGHLLAALNHPDLWVSDYALKALAQTGCTGAAPAILRKFMGDIGKTPGCCQIAAWALEELGIPQPVDAHTVDQLVAGLQQANTRDAVARVLLLCGVNYAIPHLQDPEPGVRIALLHAIDRKPAGEAVPAIIPLLSDPRQSGLERVFRAAARTLKKIGTPEALAAVEKWKK
jgi:hypothetical protein